MENKEIRHNLRENVTKLMSEKGFKSNKQVCDACGLDASRFSKLLNPKETAMPTVNDLIALSQAFDVSIDSLLGLSDPHNKDNSKNTFQWDDNTFLFNLLLYLERMFCIRFKYEFKDVNPSENGYIGFSKPTGKIDVHFTNNSLQEALYKWVDYNEKFKNDHSDYVSELLNTIRLGLLNELSKTDNEDNVLPFN